MIKRALFKHIKAHLNKKEISLIVGPRQAGKTTLMFLLKDFLQQQGKRTLYLSLDIESDHRFFDTQSGLVQKIQLEIGDKEGFVFIDEIQRKENAGLFLKGLYDMRLPYKYIISGSGSIELKEKIHESLIGRKRIFELNTISFLEFVNFKTDYRYSDKLSDFFMIERQKTKDLLIEYLNFGGYPRLVIEKERIEKTRIIDEIYSSLIEKDIGYLLRVEKTEAFSSLIKLLASQIGKIVNFSELSSTLGISLKTVKNYLWYAKKTFIVQEINPFFRNIRKEISRSPVIYFYDIGLRNYSIGFFGNITIPIDLGFLFQNFILNILQEKLTYTSGKILFWRTKDKAEVDFVIKTGERILPVEVKFKALMKPEIGRSLRNFISKYNPESAWIINLDYNGQIRINNTQINFFPFFNLYERLGTVFPWLDL